MQHVRGRNEYGIGIEIAAFRFDLFDCLDHSVDADLQAARFEFGVGGWLWHGRFLRYCALGGLTAGFDDDGLAIDPVSGFLQAASLAGQQLQDRLVGGEEAVRAGDDVLADMDCRSGGLGHVRFH